VKDFSRWFKEQKPVDDRQAHIDMLIDEDIIRPDGNGYAARCRYCEEWKELYVGPEEIDIGYVHYCGSSPRCCP
jgi:hypothetical protein